MGILSSALKGVDILSSILTLKEFVEFGDSKLNSDYSRFTHQLKDNISTICNQMRKALDESGELSDTLPPDIDEEILSLFFHALKREPLYIRTTFF